MADELDKKNNKQINKNKFDNSESKENKLALEERILTIQRISKTTEGGRKLRFRSLVVVGDLKGKYGFASAKNAEASGAIKKSSRLAARQMHTALINKKNLSVVDKVSYKFKSTKVILCPARDGTGIIAGSVVRAVLELAGFKNVVSKIYGSRNSKNVVEATHRALQKLNKLFYIRTNTNEIASIKKEQK